MSERKPVFSEREASEIILRASKLQEEEQIAYTPGVTREELVRMAAELGVDPNVLERAITEQDQRREKRPFSLIREEERVVEGEIDPGDFDLVLEQMKTRRSRRHPAVQIGKTLRAQAVSGGSLQNVEVTSRKGRTRISVKHFPFLPLFATLYPAFIGSLMAGGPLIGHGQPALAGALATGLFGAALVAMRTWLARGNQGTTELADKLQRVISADLVQPAPPVESTVKPDVNLEQRIGEGK